MFILNWTVGLDVNCLYCMIVSKSLAVFGVCIECVCPGEVKFSNGA